MSELKKRPFCGGKVEIDMLDSENSRNVKIYSAVHCPECHQWFFKGLSREKTIERWNRRAQPENAALTLDELRQMDGELVYVTYRFPAKPGKPWEVRTDPFLVDAHRFMRLVGTDTTLFLTTGKQHGLPTARSPKGARGNEHQHRRRIISVKWGQHHHSSRRTTPARSYPSRPHTGHERRGIG
jgi:hypothetical protein